MIQLLGAQAWAQAEARLATRPGAHAAGGCDTALGAATLKAGMRADERGARQGRAGLAGRAAWALGARPGRAAGMWAVHLVHSACFDPV